MCENSLRGGVDLSAFVGQCGLGDVPAQLLQLLALIGIAAHRCVQAKPLLVGTLILVSPSVARRRTLHRKHLLPGARASSESASAR